MRIELVISSVACLLSFLNLLFLIALSNSIFRILVKENARQSYAKKTAPAAQDKKDGGLVDVGEFPTYDPRFRA